MVISVERRADIDFVLQAQIEYFSLGDLLGDFVVGLFVGLVFLESASVKREAVLREVLIFH